MQRATQTPPGQESRLAAVGASSATTADLPVAVWQARYPSDTLSVWALAGLDCDLAGLRSPAPAGAAAQGEHHG